MTNSSQQLLNFFLADWREWGIALLEKPQLVKALEGGTTNSSYLIAATTKSKSQWVLRVHQQNLLFKTNREHELAIQQLAQQLQLAPQICYQHPQGNYQLYPYIEAPTISKQLPITQVRLTTLCAQLHQLHQAKPSLSDPPFSTYLYSDHINRYWRFLLQKDSREPESVGLNAADRQRYQAMLAMTLDYEKNHGQQRVLCHHDLNAENILALASGRCCILDWEFAGAGIASMDFACLATELSIDIKEMSALSGIKQNELDCAQQIYQYTCEVYNRALSHLSV